MRKTGYRYRTFVSVAAALFFALSPLLHGLHLVFSSHSHCRCCVCSSGSKSSCHDDSDCLHGSEIKISSSHNEGYPEEHDPKTCPLCQQFAQLLHTQFSLPSHLIITLQEIFFQERIVFSGDLIIISINNIIPRAPPC